MLRRASIRHQQRQHSFPRCLQQSSSHIRPAPPAAVDHARRRPVCPSASRRRLSVRTSPDAGADCPGTCQAVGSSLDSASPAAVSPKVRCIALTCVNRAGFFVAIRVTRWPRVRASSPPPHAGRDAAKRRMCSAPCFLAGVAFIVSPQSVSPGLVRIVLAPAPPRDNPVSRVEGDGLAISY